MSHLAQLMAIIGVNSHVMLRVLFSRVDSTSLLEVDLHLDISADLKVTTNITRVSS